MATPAAVLNILVTANTSQATAALAKTQTQLKATQATATKTSSGAGAAIAKGAKVGGLALAALGAVSVKAASDFESSFAEVRKTVDTSEKGFARLERGLRNLAKEIPVSVNELNDLAGQAGALGIRARDIVKFTRVAAELGITTDMSASDAANALARLANIMGTSSKDFRRLGSTLVDLGNKGASTEAEISEMALRIAASGRAAGLSEGEVLGYASALASVGINAEAGGSSISRAFDTMGSAVISGGEQLQEFAEVAGVSVGSFRQMFEKDAAGAMQVFLQGLDGIRRAGGDQVEVLKELELGDLRVLRALRGLGAAGPVLTKALENQSVAWRQNSALTEEANKRYATTASRFQVFKNRVQDVFITIGQALLPVINKLLGVLNKLNFNKAIRDLKEFWQEAGVVRAAVRVMGQVIEDVFGGLVQFIRGAVRVISGVLTGDFGRAWDGVKDIFRGAVRIIVGIVKGLTAPLRAAAKAIGNGLASAFSAAWDTIKDVFRGGANVLKNIVNWIISNVINRIPGVEIGLIGDGGGGGESGTGQSPNAIQNRYSGGKITAPMAIVGEEAPMHPEFVLATNPAYRRRNLGLWEQAGKALGVPGFQRGGVNQTDTLSAVTGAASAAAHGPGHFISMLDKAPWDSLPKFMAGTGDWVKDKFVDFIKDKVESVADFVTSGMTSASGHLAFALGPYTIPPIQYDPGHAGANSHWHISGSPPTWVVAVGKALQQMGFMVGEHPAFGGVHADHAHYGPTDHYHGGAIDVNSAADETRAETALVARLLSGRGVKGNRMGGILGLAKGGVMGKGTGLGLSNQSSLNINELTTLAAKHRIPDPAVMGAIAMAESSGNPRAVGDGGASHGLWQIHKPSWPQFSPARLFDPNYNARAAKVVRDSQGLTAWSVYNSGAYRQFLGGDVISGGGGDGGGGDGDRGASGGGGASVTIGDAAAAVEATFGEAHTPEVFKKIRKLAKLIIEIEDQIGVMEIMHAFASSPMGADLSPEERAAQIAGNDQLLAALYEYATKLEKGIRNTRPGSELRQRFQEELALVEGPPVADSKILAVTQKLDELMHPTSETGPTDAELLAEMKVPLLQEQLETAWVSNALLRSQMPTFQRLFGGMPHFGDGGVVPGPVGAPVPAVVHGGEGYFTPEQMAAMGGGGEIHNHFYIDGKEIKGIARTEVTDELGRVVRTAKRNPIVPGAKTGA